MTAELTRTAPAGSSLALQRVADTARCFGLGLISRAGSGHPGITSGMAEVTAALFGSALRFDAADPGWANRDRLVWSAGHGSALCYTLLHMFGFGVTRADLVGFRRMGSRAPGHPEFGVTPGVEATTGPLGEGLGAAVGMAIAETMLAARFNVPGLPVVDHRTYAIVSDGDLMEGVSHEAINLAGLFELDKLTLLWDDNRHTSSAPVSHVRREDVRSRFRDTGWHVVEADGHDIASLCAALSTARRLHGPVLIAARTIAGRYITGIENSHRAHAGVLAADEVERLARELRIDTDPWALEPAAEVAGYCDTVRRELAAARGRWDALLDDYAEAEPARYEQWCAAGDIPASALRALVLQITADPRPMPTREAFCAVMEALGQLSPTLVNAGIDSIRQFPRPLGFYSAGDRRGRNLNCGVREHGMAAALNGMAYHGGLRPAGSCFMSFADHLRPSLRLAAMTRLPIVYGMYNDSVLSGEDGPTHQAVEQLPGLRATPGLVVFRPADAGETAAAWQWAMEHAEPVAFSLSAGPCTPIGTLTEHRGYEGVAVGGYEVGPLVPDPGAVVVATGSELQLVLRARSELTRQGLRVKVVSMPSTTLYLRQPPERRAALTGSAGTPVLVVEAAPRWGWADVLGRPVEMLGVEEFGASASRADLAERYGFTVGNVAARIREIYVSPADG
jgi:transketolase